MPCPTWLETYVMQDIDDPAVGFLGQGPACRRPTVHPDEARELAASSRSAAQAEAGR